MPKIPTRLSLLVVPLTLTVGAMAMAHSSSPDAVSCEIRSSRSSSGILLEAVASSQARAAGEYDFVISKSGGGGTSEIKQGGEFQLSPDEEVVLGEVALGSGGGLSVRATLTLMDGDTRVCEAKFPKQD